MALAMAVPTTADARAARVNVFFVGSPLHYLCSELLASTVYRDDCNVLVLYKNHVKDLGRDSAAWWHRLYMPWPRFEPLPGTQGIWRRMLANMTLVSAAVPHCDQLYLHAPVIDTEALNYFINFFLTQRPGTQVKVRIIPDGLMNIQRHPLSLRKRVMQRVAKLRRLLDARLDFYLFSGDRTGVDAPIVDRIYVLGGFPHEYPPEKVTVLPDLVPENEIRLSDAALVLGQPLAGKGLMRPADVERLARGLSKHLARIGCTRILYKAHPKDPLKEFLQPGYEILDIDEPLEKHLASHCYPVVASVCSTGLMTAKLLYGGRVQVIAYGMEKVRTRAPGWQARTRGVFRRLGIELVEHRERL